VSEGGRAEGRKGIGSIPPPLPGGGKGGRAEAKKNHTSAKRRIRDLSTLTVTHHVLAIGTSASYPKSEPKGRAQKKIAGFRNNRKNRNYWNSWNTRKVRKNKRAEERRNPENSENPESLENPD
jgi:hypothetical protein